MADDYCLYRYSLQARAYWGRFVEKLGHAYDPAKVKVRAIDKTVALRRGQGISGPGSIPLASLCNVLVWGVLGMAAVDDALWMGGLSRTTTAATGW